MVDVTTEIIIHKPIHIVATYAANPDNAPEWYVNIKSVEWKTAKMLGVGSEVAFTANFLGRKLSYTYGIVEFMPEKKLMMRTTQGPFPMETTYTWDALNDQTTKMTLHNAGQPKGFSKLFVPFIAKAMKRANLKDLQNLKRIIESK
jgi:uncharacterized membrane protein